MSARLLLALTILVTAPLAPHTWAQGGENHVIGNEPQLFVDDALIARKKGLVRRAHACEKLAEPVMVPAKPWEQDGDDQRIYIYGTVMHDADSGHFRMWYNRLDLVLYAASEDGLTWHRPELGLCEWDGSKANNIVLQGFHSPSVVHVPDAPSDRRYVMLGNSHKEGRGYHIAMSPDGLHWTWHPRNRAAPGGDTCTLAYDAGNGTYLAFHKRSHEYRGHERRLVYLTTSRDLLDWTEPKLVMAPDESDDAQAEQAGGICAQFYNMSAFPYGGHFLGFVTVFLYTGPPERKGPLQSGNDGPIHVQLVHSRDGRSWNRCEDRSPVIPNGPYDYDAGCILGVANGPVCVDDELWVYYTAITTTHGGFVPEKRITIALAKWRRDGFVSLDAGGEPGVVRTAPLTFEATRLRVNAAVGGTLTAAIIDGKGDAVAGYGHGDCRAVTGDSVRHDLTWQNHDGLPEEQPVSIEFRMTNGQLFSYTVTH